MTQVLMVTNMGNITIQLNDELAPVTAANFKAYVEEGFYDGVIFHRVIKGFMIQGGGFNEKFDEKITKESIRNEANNGLTNVRGSIAMARTQDPHSASAQFFINHKDNDFLNHTKETVSGWGYAVFGEIISQESFDTLDKISAVKTGKRGYHSDVPIENVIIESAKII